MTRTAIAGSGLILPGFQKLGHQSEPLKVALIGAGWYGMVITEAALRVGGVEVIGVCDVDSQFLEDSIVKLESIQGTRPKGYSDYREMLDMPGLQAVFIGTPPHWHALQFIDACERGLHIYCEKPLAYDVSEGQAMWAAAKRAGNIVQIGFQRRQSASFREVKAMISRGDIGPVHSVQAQIHYRPNLLDTTPQDPPASLDWEAWCGPAPKLPYCPQIGHKAWRLEQAYGHGHLVDWGIHHIDIIRQIMDLDMPHTIEAKGGMRMHQGKFTTPDTLSATWHFDDLQLRWEHRLWGTGAIDRRFNNGIYFFGEEGTLFASDQKIYRMSLDRDADIEELDHRIPDMRDRHMADFLKAVQMQDASYISCPIDEGFRSTALVQMAAIAYETDSVLQWDHENMEVKGNQAVQSRLARPYRHGYKRPKAG